MFCSIWFELLADDYSHIGMPYTWVFKISSNNDGNLAYYTHLKWTVWSTLLYLYTENSAPQSTDSDHMHSPQSFQVTVLECHFIKSLYIAKNKFNILESSWNEIIYFFLEKLLINNCCFDA